MKRCLITGIIMANILYAGGAAFGDSVVAIDLGRTGQHLFTETYDGTSGFRPLSCAGPANIGIAIAGTTALVFENVCGWNTGDNGASSNLLQDFFYSAGTGPADDPVTFRLIGLQPGEYVKLEFAGSYQKGARVVFNGVTTDVPVGVDEGAFTDVGTVTGSSSYTGTFTQYGGGPGEGNLSAVRITITDSRRTLMVTNAFEFGVQGQRIFTDAYDSSSNFVAASLNVAWPNVGYLLANFGPGNTGVLNIRGASGWSADGGGACSNLIGDYIYSVDGGATNPVPIDISGVATSDTVMVECISSVEHSCRVTLGGWDTIVPASVAGGSFTWVASLTGSTNYDGTFTGPEGSGQGDLSGMRITVSRYLPMVGLTLTIR